METLEIAKVNFTDPDDVTAFAHKLGRHAAEAGMLQPGTGKHPMAADIRAAAREWIRRTDAVADSLTPSGAFSVMSAYDLVHRIAYGKPALPDTVNRHVLRAFEAMLRGDKAVDRYAMFRHISAALSRKDKAYLGRPLQWYSITLDRWHTQFRTGTSRVPLPVSDTIEIVTILLESDLWLFETRNEAAYKQRLLNNHRQYLPSLTNTVPSRKSNSLPK